MRVGDSAVDILPPRTSLRGSNEHTITARSGPALSYRIGWNPNH